MQRKRKEDSMMTTHAALLLEDVGSDAISSEHVVPAPVFGWYCPSQCTGVAPITKYQNEITSKPSFQVVDKVVLNFDRGRFLLKATCAMPMMTVKLGQHRPVLAELFVEVFAESFVIHGPGRELRKLASILSMPYFFICSNCLAFFRSPVLMRRCFLGEPYDLVIRHGHDIQFAFDVGVGEEDGRVPVSWWCRVKPR